MHGTTIAQNNILSIICSCFFFVRRIFIGLVSPLEIVFQDQSYSSLHSGRILAWDHFRGDIDDPCCIIADFCRVIAVPWGDHETLVKHCDTLWNVVKHPEPLLKHPEPLLIHCQASWNTLKTLWNITKHSNTCHSMRRYRLSARGHQRLARWYRRSLRVSGNIGVGITPQMCKRVTNHGDMGTFSKPA